MPTAEKHISKAPPLTLTVEEVAAIARVSQSHVRALIKDGTATVGGEERAYRIPTRWACDTYRLDPADVAAFVAARKGDE